MWLRILKNVFLYFTNSCSFLAKIYVEFTTYNRIYLNKNLRNLTLYQTMVGGGIPSTWHSNFRVSPNFLYMWDPSGTIVLLIRSGLTPLGFEAFDVTDFCSSINSLPNEFTNRWMFISPYRLGLYTSSSLISLILDENLSMPFLAEIL